MATATVSKQHSTAAAIDIPFGRKTPLDQGYIIMGTHGHGDLGWVLSCQIATLVWTGL